MEDRRQKGRIQTSLAIIAANPPVSPDARIINMSFGGAFIATDCPLPEDSALAIDIQLPGDPERITVNARVVWNKSVSNATSAGMGIEFTDILDRHQTRLSRFIEQNLSADGV
ncbi:MAG: hypothetical protein FJ119_15105 [Deltaproteobacteria bacterium]|nr:hypothetical protein [Deltaproteobacteria bacterium]